MKTPTPASAPLGRPSFSRASLLLLLPALGLTAIAQETPTPVTPPTEDDVVNLSAFRVSEDKDSGYKASNSIGGTRSNTPIKDIPLNIQVFTKDLYDDLVITNQIDLERYNAALVNGGADGRSSNPIQQAYNAFLFRGFVQNWGLRDGIRQYDPIDTQGLSRVEIVKGPAGPLYGLSYAGGVMNSVTKDVDFLKDFTSLRFTVQSEGEYRAAIDANYSGDTKHGKFGVRFNGAHAETVDERENSDGSLRYSQVNLAWQPYAGTEVKFLMENGYRGKANGLGYFTRNGADGAQIPLQIDHPEIPWEWNWSTGGNIRSIDTDLYRGTINQTFNENFSATAYVQYATRLNIDSNGWEAQGSGGGANWDTNGDTGWQLGGTPAEFIRLGYHYRDWGNRMHGYGATGIYKVDLGAIKNVVTFGANVWAEKFLTRRFAQPSTTTNTLILPVRAGISINTPLVPPADWAANTGNGGWNRENNSNDYYFVAWQGSLFENRLKLNAAANRTNIKLVQYDATANTSKTTEVSKTSPMFGAMFDITKQVSVFGVYSSSLFPSTDKNSFSQQMPPETGKSYEAGVKVELLNGKISGTVSVYQITKEGGGKQVTPAFNLEVQRFDALSLAQQAIQFPGQTRATLLAKGDFYPAGEQESTGFEADLIFQPTKSWQILLSYANNDTEVTSSPIATELGRTTSGHIDQQLAMLTKYSFTDGAAKGLSIGAGIQYADEALQDYNGPGNTGRYNPATFYGELFAGYRLKLLGYDTLIQLNLKNITEQEEFVGWKPTGVAGRVATDRYEVSTPMVYSLTVGIDF
ncbi:TonB-dependent siderophore receptor [Nibricoccus aquaticus]|nr:TonB-dependent receptor plug domain-containing protein [Nibricoccus aquaticus]